MILDTTRAALLALIAGCNVVGWVTALASMADPAYARATAFSLGLAILAYLVLLGSLIL